MPVRFILFMPTPHAVSSKFLCSSTCLSLYLHIAHCKVVACLSCHCSRMPCPILCNVIVDAHKVPMKKSFGRQSTMLSLADAKSSWRSWLKPTDKMSVAIEAPGTGISIFSEFMIKENLRSGNRYVRRHLATLKIHIAKPMKEVSARHWRNQN